MSNLGNRNKGNNGNAAAANTERQQISPLSKVVFMLYGGLQFICNLLLGWKAYDPGAWLPMPPVSTFLVIVISTVVFWILWLNSITVLGKKDQ